MNEASGERSGRGGEAGFTLVEALVAVVVLVFGLMAVTNLMLVAASSNSVANQGTAAVNTATRVMDMVKSNSYASFGAVGANWETPAGGGPSCGDPAAMSLGVNHCTDSIPGVGSIHAHWWLEPDPTDARLYFVRVRAEGLGALAGARSRAEFTTFRSCTNLDGGCPEANGSTGPSPSPSPTP
jgi:type II secretory pathway pseudopilin PulG